MIVILAAIGSKDARKKALNAGARIKALELKYEQYVEKHIQNHILESRLDPYFDL